MWNMDELTRFLERLGPQGERLLRLLRRDQEAHGEWLRENIPALIAQGNEAMETWGVADPRIIPEPAWNQLIGLLLAASRVLEQRYGRLDDEAFDRVFRSLLAAFQLGVTEGRSDGNG